MLLSNYRGPRLSLPLRPKPRQGLIASEAYVLSRLVYTLYPTRGFRAYASRIKEATSQMRLWLLAHVSAEAPSTTVVSNSLVNGWPLG
ncbi:hypothetical protein VTI74DRAFT_432 [Chaetomium olivicolor]